MNEKKEATNLLDMLNEILKPKMSPVIDANELTQAATQLHSMFEIFVKAGFTEPQALELVGRMLKN